jgi:CopG family nickel-responsive transcriptional regulator
MSTRTAAETVGKRCESLDSLPGAAVARDQRHGEYVECHTVPEEIEGDAVAAVAFDYEHTLVIGDLHTVQHEFQDVIGTTHHMHHGEWCLESVFCRGPAGRIRDLVYQLRDFDAVGRVNVTFLEPTG